MKVLGPSTDTWTSELGVCHALYYDGGGWYSLRCSVEVAVHQSHTTDPATVTCLFCLGHRSVENR